MFWNLFSFAGTQQGKLHQMCVTTSWVTYFILLALTETSVSHSQHRKNSGEFGFFC